MKTKVLSAPERYDFYKTYLLQDFHENEVKPFELIEKLVQQEKYLCFGFFNDTEPLGYAYFTKSDNEQALLQQPIRQIYCSNCRSGKPRIYIRRKK